MSGAPPTSTYVNESIVIHAPVAKVWHLIKLQDFSKWYSALASSSVAKNISDEVTDSAIWKFKDGHQLTVKQEEHSAINHSITYSVVEAEPALTYHSVLSTITVSPVTTGPSEGSSYVTWSGSFSSDADAGVIADASYKRKEALADLAKAVA
ncbi:BQ2448_5894 [Microbotryum intermedium]|uniref:BQ2448_5894 protein n=1 Tax=Microbotryum intermedium TaxID=269621 RepID=A0A238F7U7_9BASI|nr:BQ2448_5894 [Microbotryum intermedium]